MKTLSLVLAAALAATGCSSRSKTDQVGRYDLACDVAAINGAFTWGCAVVDTRKGVVWKVDFEHLGTSDGAGYATASPVGRWKIACNSVGDFRCLRLDTTTGDVLYVDK